MRVNFAFWDHYLMMLKSSHIAPISAVFFTLMLPFSGFAQEDKVGFDTEIQTKESVKQDHETPSGGDSPEIRPTKNSSAPAVQDPAVIRDSELKNIKPSLKTVDKSLKEEEKAQKKEDDPLSFNFLYYIIEKFKLSDIVE